MRLSIIWIIFRKEITEALRDRVTLLVLVGLPLLLYPLTIMTMMGVIKHQAAVEERQVNTVAVWGVGATALLDWLALNTNRFKLERWQAIPPSLRSELEAGRLQPPPPRTIAPSAPAALQPGLPGLSAVLEAAPEDAVLQAVRDVVSGGQADAVLIIWPGFDDAQQRHDLGRVAVYYDSILPRSAQAWSRLSGQLSQFRQHLLKERQRERGLPEGFAKALDIRGDDVAPAQRQVRSVLGQVLPSLLMLLALVGALVAATDLTAGEKDRATMQTLLCGSSSWRWFLRGDRQRPSVPTPGLVLTWFPLAVVGLFYASLALAEQGLPTILLVTQYGVLLLPVLALAVVRKYPLAQTFSLHRPHWRSVVGSVLIGLTVSVVLAGLVLRVAPPPDSVLNEMQQLLQLGDHPAALWKLWLVLAFTPALCEETLFRGLMLSGLRRWGPWAAIGITALLFGLLHGSIYRLLPTFILGLVLGYVVWRSGSLYCSLLIHALNNGLIATLVWRSHGKEMDIQAVPWSLTLGALVVTGIGVGLITGPKPPPAPLGQQP